jgi:iron complex outermembrane receptor protein
MNRNWRLNERGLRQALLSLAFLLPGLVIAQSAEVAEIADLPFEQLLHTEVVTADKLARQISNAPSAVSIVTAQDIRDFGYRSLSDILDSMRGLSMSHKSNYGFLSGRGYGNAGSYSGRITLLIDGYRAPENYSGQIFFGSDGLIDVELIDRVEYIPGNGSSSYGDSAFLGVVNIITKTGRDIAGAELSTETGSHGWKRNRVTFGKQFDSGLDLVISASDMISNGRLLPADMVDSGVGKVENGNNQRFFLKAAYDGVTFEYGQVSRPMWSPIVERQERNVDTNSFVRLKFDRDLAEHLKTSVDFYYGQSRFTASYLDDPATNVRGYSESGGNWRGVDAKFVGTWFDRHTLVWGAEYRSDFKQYDWGEIGGVLDYSFSARRRTNSIYAYDDIALSPGLQLNIGARRDVRDNGSATLSPRGALVYSPFAGSTLRLSTGVAHHQPTAYAEFYAANTPPVERAATREIVWEQMLGPRTRWISSVYRYRIDNFVYDLGFGTIGDTYASLLSQGAETELEHLWGNGVRLRTSYAYQDTHYEDGSRTPNSPHHIAKFNLSFPLAGEKLKLALSARYLGARLNMLGGSEPAVLTGDLTLTSKWNHWFSSFSARNLGDVAYREVSGAMITSQGVYPADRRNFWFQLGYEFK